MALRGAPGGCRLPPEAEAEPDRGQGARMGEGPSGDLRGEADSPGKLKRGLLAAGARGERVSDPEPEPQPQPPPQANPGPAAPKKKRKRSGGGPSPVLVVGAALVAGIVLAKVVDWRGHAHPRD